jgi:hypothetical protein
MKKSLLQIIKEELNNFFSDWSMNDEPSIADKYYEKNLGTMTRGSEPETKLDGELVGYVTKQWKTPLPSPIPVHKNPRNLNGFTKETRGILLNTGDLYVAQSYNALHDNILDLLAEKGIIPLSSKFDYDKKYPEQFVAVQRTFNTNNFAQSMAYDYFPPHYEEIFEIGRQKQPYTFKAIPLSND